MLWSNGIPFRGESSQRNDWWLEARWMQLLLLLLLENVGKSKNPNSLVKKANWDMARFGGFFLSLLRDGGRKLPHGFMVSGPSPEAWEVSRPTSLNCPFGNTGKTNEELADHHLITNFFSEKGPSKKWKETKNIGDIQPFFPLITKPWLSYGMVLWEEGYNL